MTVKNASFLQNQFSLWSLSVYGCSFKRPIFQVQRHMAEDSTKTGGTWILIFNRFIIHSCIYDMDILSCRDKPLSVAGCHSGRIYSLFFFCRASLAFVSLRTGLVSFVCLEWKGFVWRHNWWWLAYYMQTLHKSPSNSWKVMYHGV